MSNTLLRRLSIEKSLEALLRFYINANVCSIFLLANVYIGTYLHCHGDKQKEQYCEQFPCGRFSWNGVKGKRTIKRLWSTCAVRAFEWIKENCSHGRFRLTTCIKRCSSVLSIRLWPIRVWLCVWLHCPTWIGYVNNNTSLWSEITYMMVALKIVRKGRRDRLPDTKRRMSKWLWFYCFLDVKKFLEAIKYRSRVSAALAISRNANKQMLWDE